jgi:magnesium-transporting ATPase (P-type)
LSLLTTSLHSNIKVLFFATIVSLAIKDWIEGGVLAVVIVLNVSIGFLQEYKAEKKMDALRALSSPSASVIRDGKVQVISKYVPNVYHSLDWPVFLKPPIDCS